MTIEGIVAIVVVTAILLGVLLWLWRRELQKGDERAGPPTSGAATGDPVKDRERA